MFWPGAHAAERQGLTPRSSRAPTACHQRPAGGTRYIFATRALASCRRRPLSSNVRRRMPTRSAASAFSGNTPRAQRGTSVLLAYERRRRVRVQQVASRRSVGKVHTHAEPGNHCPQASARLGPAAPPAHCLRLLSTILLHQLGFSLAFRRQHVATPNPSVNRSANGMPPAPGQRYAVHFRRPGAGVTPLSPGYLER